MVEIATINKDDILYKWIIEGLAYDYPILFQFLQVVQGWAAISPIQGESVVKTYLNGDMQRQYDFMLQVAFQTSDDPDSNTNTDNMLTLHQWQDWIDEQQELKNHPDFGDKCSDYQLENLSNMPMMAGRQDDGMAKYQFPARLSYFETKGVQ